MRLSKKMVIGAFLFLLLFLYFYIPFTIDQRNCERDYDGFTCLNKYVSYQINEFQSKCYITSNESYLPEINQMKNLVVDVYLANTNLTKTDIQNEFYKVNSIWNRYGLNFTVQAIDSKENVNLEGLESNTYELVNRLNKYFNFSRSQEYGNTIVILGYINEQEGGVYLSNIEGILISTKAGNLAWTIAHELGHIMGLYDKAFYSGEVNLMTHEVKVSFIPHDYGCITKLYPTNLNKIQVETIYKPRLKRRR